MLRALARPALRPGVACPLLKRGSGPTRRDRAPGHSKPCAAGRASTGGGWETPDGPDRSAGRHRAPPPSARAGQSPRPLLTAGRGAGGGGRDSNGENHAPSGRAGPSPPLPPRRRPPAFSAGVSAGRAAYRSRRARSAGAFAPRGASAAGPTAPSPPGSPHSPLYGTYRSPPRASFRAVTPSLGLGTSLLCPLLVPRVRDGLRVLRRHLPPYAVKGCKFYCFPLSSQAPTLPNSTV